MWRTVTPPPAQQAFVSVTAAAVRHVSLGRSTAHGNGDAKGPSGETTVSSLTATTSLFTEDDGALETTFSRPPVSPHALPSHRGASSAFSSASSASATVSHDSNSARRSSDTDQRQVGKSLAEGDDSHPQSGAALAAAIMRRHRLHSASSYLTVSSGVEVPGCAGGSYHLQGRAPGYRVGRNPASQDVELVSYLSRTRSCAQNMRISNFPSPRSPPAPSSSSSATVTSSQFSTQHRPHRATTDALPMVLLRDAEYHRCQQYEPFDRVLHGYLGRGFVAHAAQRLLHHPDAPAPAVLLDLILRHRLPSPSLTCQALLAILHASRRDRNTAAAAAFALERVVRRLRTEREARVLYDVPGVRVLLLEALLAESLFDAAVEVATETPTEWITPPLWSRLTVLAGQSKLPHSGLLWRLLSLGEGKTTTMAAEVATTEGTRPASSLMGPLSPVLTRAGESALLGALQQAPVMHPQLPLSTVTGTAEEAAAEAPAPTPQKSGRGVCGMGELPDAVLDTRACATVPISVGDADGAFGSSTMLASSTALGAHDGREKGDEPVAEGMWARADRALLAESSASPMTALALSDSRGVGHRAHWCALGSVELGYAMEHYNGESCPAAGSFKAVGAAGVLYSYPSFHALQMDVEGDALVTHTTGHSSSNPNAESPLLPSLSPGETKAQRRVLWETTALRMVSSHQGIVYGLDATTAARVLLRCGVSFSAQASPLLALQVLRRYLRSCRMMLEHVTQAQQTAEEQLNQLERHAMGKAETSLPAASSPSAAEVSSSASVAEKGASSLLVMQLPVQPGRKMQKQLDALYPRLARAVRPHPAPFLVFFKVMREARGVLSHSVAALKEGLEEDGDVGEGVAAFPTRLRGRSTRAGVTPVMSTHTRTALPMLHWELVWRTFQELNRVNATWVSQLEVQEAADMCLDVIEVLCHGADPWLTLNVSRSVSARHIVDGVDMALWLLHRLDASHHTDEAREVAQKLFRWLLVDVGVHVQPSLHHHLVPAARALIRLGLQAELSTLYNAVLDNVYLFATDMRDAFVRVLQDLTCPACACVLPERDVYVDRTCPNCMAMVSAKSANTLPSFHLSAEHVERIRARRKLRRQQMRQRLTASVRRLEEAGGKGDDALKRRQQRRDTALRPPRDAAKVLRYHLQKRDPATDVDMGGVDSTDDAEGLLRQSSSGFSSVEAAPLVPGVPVSSAYALFAVEGGAADGVPVLNAQAALVESSRRLELQRVARSLVLAQRGVTGMLANDRERAVQTWTASRVRSLSPAAALPTSAPLHPQNVEASAFPTSSTTAAWANGAWRCVWCQEKNTEWSSRVQCGACGAETGPAAPWRRFAYAKEDIMEELRGRMGNCEARPIDAIVAGYMLMVYRRTFQLRATPADQERLLRLVEVLCQLQERVLAAYVYIRLVPVTQRHLGRPLSSLAQVFGQEATPSFKALTQADLTRSDAEEVVFEAIFGAETCRVCFGEHDWRACPIITRNFAAADGAAAAASLDTTADGALRTAIRLSPEEKRRAVLERLAMRLVKAVASIAPAAATSEAAAPALSAAALLPPGKPNVQLVMEVYTAFVSSLFRESFAELHAEETNKLSLLLTRVRQYRRAAFVLCHIPPAKRATESYLRLAPYFNVTEAEALALLEPSTTRTTATINFVQVTQTCCMCFDARHAAHACPRLGDWLKGVQQLMASGANLDGSGPPLVDRYGEAPLRRRLKAQVEGWISAGPERLHTFSRFMQDQVDLLRSESGATAMVGPPADGCTHPPEASRQMDLENPLVYAVNKTITKLATVGRRSEAYRLYARAPVECVSAETTAALLRLNGFSDENVCKLLAHPGSDGVTNFEGDVPLGHQRVPLAFRSAPTAAREAAVPVRRCCLLCFSPDHVFVECPELTSATAEVDRLLRVVREVGGIRCVRDGIDAAAAFVYSEYNGGRLSSELMRSHPDLVRALLSLARRCFATRQVRHGVNVLRRLPVEMVPPDVLYPDLWRAAGLSDAEVEQRETQLLALFDASGVRPCIDPVPPRPTYTNAFFSQLNRTLHDDLCRHCYEHGHTIATCPLFHAEVSFGRDFVAAYRMSMMSEQLDRAWQEAYLVKLVDFVATHYLYMPYHIAGVANALNAITAMWSFRGEPGIALRHLFRIPPAYRRRQAFKHVLHCLRVPPADVTRLLGDLPFSPDHRGAVPSSSSFSTSATSSESQRSLSPAQQDEAVVMAQHLLLPRPSIRDVARKQILERVPAAMVALEESDSRMAVIRARHAHRLKDGGTSMSEQIRQGLPQRPSSSSSQQPSSSSAPVSSSQTNIATDSKSAPQRIMQCGGIAQLREDFDPILSELENAVGMRLGSRHILFTSAVDILSAATAASGTTVTATSTPSGARGGAAVRRPLASTDSPPRRGVDDDERNAAPPTPTAAAPQTAGATASMTAAAQSCSPAREAEVVSGVCVSPSTPASSGQQQKRLGDRGGDRDRASMLATDEPQGHVHSDFHGSGSSSASNQRRRSRNRRPRHRYSRPSQSGYQQPSPHHRSSP